MNTEVGSDILKAKSILDKGNLVIVPTETVYGLAANALNQTAVEKIYQFKKRPLKNPLILHFGQKKLIYSYIKNFPKVLSELADIYWPGPLTILLEKNENVPDIVCSGLNRIAVRIPNKSLFLSLLNNLDYPLAAPSANLYGKISPTRVKHVQKYFNGIVEYILDGNSCETGIESTIIGLEKGKVVIYRPGMISQEQIKSVIGYNPEIIQMLNNIPLASGMVRYHYAPETPCFEFINEDHKVFNKKYGYILFSKNYNQNIDQTNVKLISQNESIVEAAENLYNAMHELDEIALEKIYIELLPDEGQGIALNDKIKKAFAKF